MNRFDLIESLERRTLFNSLVFSKPVFFPAGTNPSQIFAADLNHDGKVDAVVSDFGSASVAVLMGNGDGTFQSAAFYATGVHPSSVAVGDLTGSGIDDIVVSNEASDTVSVLMGNGDGTFSPQVTYPVGGLPQWVALADLNQDGKLDIVTADRDTNSVSVLLNNGDGTFGPTTSYFAGYHPSSVAVADFNSDGFPDLAVTNPDTDQIHILKNNGLGQFSFLKAAFTGPAPRAMAIADLNLDTRPDIVTADLDSAAVSILGGNGNGTLRPLINHLAGLRPESVIIADMNGDNRPDIVTADVYNNGVAVVLTGFGFVAQPKSFLAGNGPVSVVAADVNGDGKLDLITADFNSGQIAVLQNRTFFKPQVQTTATLTPSQNPVETGNKLVVDVRIGESAASPRKPTGVVQFFVNGGFYAAKVVSTTGLARLTIPNIAPGTYVLTAHYVGDQYFTASDTPAVMETVEPQSEATPFVVPDIRAVHLPENYVPGAHGVVDVVIYDAGAGPAIGTVQVHLFASTSSTFGDSTVFPVPTITDPVVSLRLMGNQTRIVPIGFHMPTTIDGGNYTLFAVLTPVSGLTASQVSTVPAVGLTTQQAVLQFGRVSTQPGFKLTRTLPGGDQYSLQLTGPGTGNVSENADGGISIAMTGTASNSVLHIISSTGVILDGLIENSIMAGVDAPTTDLDGPVHLEFGVHKVTLNNISNCELVLGGGLPNELHFGNLSNVNLFSGAPIASLSVASYTNQPGDMITTAWIHSLTSAGDFGASVFINGGVGARNLGLSSATIAGTVGSAVWKIQANVGNVQVGGVEVGWSGSIRGSLGSFIDTGNFAGELAAHHIGLLEIDGNATSADILAGADFGADGRFGNNDDTFASGTLDTLHIGGSVTGSVFAAGLKPAGGVILGPGATLLRRSGIGSISIGGTLDTNSRFLAVSLPKLITIDGVQLSSTGNGDFVT